jgi:hypothetical protein
MTKLDKRRTVLAGAMALALAIPGIATGETTVHEINTPFALTVTNPCTGELVAIEGTLDTIMQTTPDASGGVHHKIHFGSKGTGTVLLSSTRYVFSEELNAQLSAGGGTTLTQTINHFLTSAGATDNFFLKMTFHFTINGMGVPTASVDHFETGCRG